MRRRAVALIVVLAVQIACGDSKPAPADTVSAAGSVATLPAGEAMLTVPDGRIWYKKIGGGTGTPLILVHGGPGGSSVYHKSLEALGSDRPVIRYDQLGGGKSDRITDTSLFNVRHFVRELDSLRASLGYDKVHLFGDSWGTMLAVEYYRAHPQHVASMVLASATLDIPAYKKNETRLLKTLPDSTQQTIAAAEAAKRYNDPKYQAAMGQFFALYFSRRPVQAEFDSLLASTNQDIYNYMLGPSAFTATGTLKAYDATTGLKDIEVPTLFTVGEFDLVGPEVVRGYAAKTPGAKYEVIRGAGHMTMWDNPEALLRVVRDFLKAADTSRRPR
ncbi:MAG: proline iminopeptidase-family hydrolase [Gemmatimonadaceae bacterium]